MTEKICGNRAKFYLNYIGFSCFLVFSLIFPRMSLAKVLSLDEVKQVQGKLKSFQKLALDFTQTIERPERKNNLVRKGELYLAKPKMFRWIIKKDKALEQQEYIYDGKDLFIYSPEQKYANRSKSGAPYVKLVEDIVEIFLNSEALLRQYSLKKADLQGKILLLQLDPQKSDTVKQIDVKIDTDKNLVTYLKILDKNNYNSTFDFSEAKIFAEKDVKNIFSLPKGTKIENL